ncbi:hypothetical protein CASFOL_042185 [Castilleja foliolosa]|uniref:Uncharacterized protein n=1 Tax=Castilleja foliolosa TaxID=1961234 RepID=A0ABD3BAI4_9LAMI
MVIPLQRRVRRVVVIALQRRVPQRRVRQVVVIARRGEDVEPHEPSQHKSKTHVLQET